MRWRSASASTRWQRRTKRERVERRVDDGDHVQIGALGVGPADWIGLEDLRPGDDVAEAVEGERQMALAVAEVGAEGDDRPVRRARRDVVVGARAADVDGRRLDVLGDRRAQLGHRELDRFDTVEADGDLGDAIGEPFEQDVLVLPDDGGDPVGDLPVVHGVGELVAASGVVQVDDEREVDAQRLGDLALVGQGADDGRDHQAVDLDPVGHRRHATRG